MKDFEEMVQRTDVDLWDKAVEQLTTVVQSLISNSVTLRIVGWIRF